MTTNFEKVGEFMKAMFQEVKTSPELPPRTVEELRLDLIQEELMELSRAVLQNDLVGIADGLTDILYVVYGTGHAYGIDLDKTFEEVHNSNMTKLGPDGVVIKSETGKVLKPDTYRPPDLESIIFPE